jgi:hypothetical protein
MDEVVLRLFGGNLKTNSQRTPTTAQSQLTNTKRDIAETLQKKEMELGEVKTARARKMLEYAKARGQNKKAIAQSIAMLNQKMERINVAMAHLSKQQSTLETVEYTAMFSDINSKVVNVTKAVMPNVYVYFSQHSSVHFFNNINRSNVEDEHDDAIGATEEINDLFQTMTEGLGGTEDLDDVMSNLDKEIEDETNEQVGENAWKDFGTLSLTPSSPIDIKNKNKNTSTSTITSINPILAQQGPIFPTTQTGEPPFLAVPVSSNSNSNASTKIKTERKRLIV